VHSFPPPAEADAALYRRRSAGKGRSGRSSEADIPVTAATARSFLRGIRAHCLMPLALVGLPMAVSLWARAAGPPALAIARATGSIEDGMTQTPKSPPYATWERVGVLMQEPFLLRPRLGDEGQWFCRHGEKSGQRAQAPRKLCRALVGPPRRHWGVALTALATNDRGGDRSWLGKSSKCGADKSKRAADRGSCDGPNPSERSRSTGADCAMHDWRRSGNLRFGRLALDLEICRQVRAGIKLDLRFANR
jgi:hypothetical protein